MGQLFRLHPRERVLHDGDAIAALYKHLGAAAAEDLINRSLAELAMALSGLAAQVRRHDLTDLARRVQKLRLMADHLGMVSLSRVASDVRQCLETADGTGFAAVWARLLRVAARSLNLGQDWVDLSG